MCYIIYNFANNTLFSYIEDDEPIWTENINEAFKPRNYFEALHYFDLLKDDYEVNLLSIDVLK